MGITLRILTVLLSFLTVLSGWVALFNPAKYWLLAVTGLGFPILFVVNFLVFIFWLIQRKPIATVAFLAILITIIKLPYVLQFNTKTSNRKFTEGQSPEVKIMSFNVRLFDLYNWTHNQQTRLKIFDFLSSAQPDILCLQEFYTDNKEFNNLKEMKEIMKKGEVHSDFPITLNKSEHWGIITYTTFPIVNKGTLTFDSKSANSCIYTDIKVNNDTLRIYNCHLQSVKLGNKEYEFIENPGEDNKESIKRTFSIVSRLKKAFIKRASQARQIAEHIKTCPYPIVLCGDFNDTPLSYTYKQISDLLTDTWRESGNGIGSTYRGPIPGLRIDYIFHNERVFADNFKVNNLNLSDHDPVSATIIIKP